MLASSGWAGRLHSMRPVCVWAEAWVTLEATWLTPALQAPSVVALWTTQRFLSATQAACLALQPYSMYIAALGCMFIAPKTPCLVA